MNKVFIFNANSSHLDIRDAIVERITKAKAITSIFLSQNTDILDVDNEIIGMFWALNDYLDEIEYLYKIITKNHATKEIL